ncbi:MAG: hypothetical protein RR956_05940 [Christensenella sp.]
MNDGRTVIESECAGGEMSATVLDHLARATLEAAKRYYSNPENCRKAIRWYTEKYGHPPTDGYCVAMLKQLEEQKGAK